MLNFWQIVPYVILIILMYQIFEIWSTSEVMALFPTFFVKFLTNYTYKHYRRSSLHKNWSIIIAEAILINSVANECSWKENYASKFCTAGNPSLMIFCEFSCLYSDFKMSPITTKAPFYFQNS